MEEERSWMGTMERKWQISRGDFKAAARARHEFVSALRQCGGAQSEVQTAAVIFGELVTNATRLAKAEAIAVLTVSDVARLRVSEDSDSPPPVPVRRVSDDETSGRGLHIVQKLAARVDFEVLHPGFAVSVVLPISKYS